jgi:hypothetical protein
MKLLARNVKTMICLGGFLWRDGKWLVFASFFSMSKHFQDFLRTLFETGKVCFKNKLMSQIHPK